VKPPPSRNRSKWITEVRGMCGRELSNSGALGVHGIALRNQVAAKVPPSDVGGGLCAPMYPGTVSYFVPTL
jgi:hypothetical protein